MRHLVRLRLAVALFGSLSAVAASAQDAGPLAALQARGTNPEGPVARRLASSDAVVAKRESSSESATGPPPRRQTTASTAADW